MSGAESQACAPELKQPTNKDVAVEGVCFVSGCSSLVQFR